MTKILIADDASFMRLMISEILARRGLTNIVEAENGRLAVDLYKSNKPDLTLLDITMPVLNGLAALEEIMVINPLAKVIICSALAHESMVIDALKLGAVDFVAKPFRPDELLRTVSKYLN